MRTVRSLKLQRKQVQKSTPVGHIPEDHDEIVETEALVDPSREITVSKKRPTWFRSTIQDAEKYGAPIGSFRESKRPRRYSNYMALMSDIIDIKPSSSEEAAD